MDDATTMQLIYTNKSFVEKREKNRAIKLPPVWLEKVGLTEWKR